MLLAFWTRRTVLSLTFPEQKCPWWISLHFPSPGEEVMLGTEGGAGGGEMLAETPPVFPRSSDTQT